MSDEDRRKMFAEVTRTALQDSAIVPLWMANVTALTRKAIAFTPRSDGMFFVQNVRPE
ncbi:hypothetical protein [Propylenella binzhouense]|uniref:hypothetical protein n=1 Tax=Propylenella binzhouense TaxID=2555902 RepID=UPI00136825F9|nr:hypothetical protein [Propylenella binzhouense]